MDSISQAIHDCETCASDTQANWVEASMVWRMVWPKYMYGKVWQVDEITLPEIHQEKHYVLTKVEATTGWLETYPVPHAIARNTILGLEKEVLW